MRKTITVGVLMIMWALGTAGLVMWSRHQTIAASTCHSTQEDSEIYDCNFDGPTHSWTRK
jgi:hypothetical protein